MKRDLLIDSSRGFILFLMLIGRLPGVIRNYSYQMFGFVWPAEGFVFISGFSARIVYTRVFFTSGFAMACKKALRRARTIYLYRIAACMAIFLFLFCLAL